MSYRALYLSCFFSLWFISVCSLNVMDFYPGLKVPHFESKLARAASDTCSLVQCNGKGQSCAADFSSDAAVCNAGNATCCAQGLFCHEGTCLFDTIGAFCNTTANIPCISAPGERLACIANQCVYQGSANDGCNQNTDCLGIMQCVNGLCQGISEGSNCTVSFTSLVGMECAYGSICINNLCVPWLTQGQLCNVSSVCEFGTFCHEETLKCEPLYSVSTGDPCEFSFECFDGDAACLNGICADTNNWASCSDNSQCTTGFNCTCDNFVGESICQGPPSLTPNPITNCIKDSKQLLDCLVNNQCSFPLSFTNQHTSTCANQHCLFEMDNAIGCNCQYQKAFSGNCLFSDTCSVRLLRDWQIALIVIGAIVLVALIIAIIVIAVKRSKRSQYDKV